MNEPVNIDERLAALLDGRLDEAERNALLAELAVPGDDYTVLAETAAILLALEEEDALVTASSAIAAPDAAPPAAAHVPTEGPAGVIPLRPRAPVWRRPVARMALAACVAALVLAGALLLRGRGSAAGGPVELAMALERGSEGLPPKWTDSGRWEESRGEGGGSESSAQAVQAGVRLVDLSVAIRAGDSAHIALIAGQLHAHNDRALGPRSPFKRIAERAGAPRDSLVRLLAEGTESLERVRREPLRMGAWLQAAWLAAQWRDAAFFREHGVPSAADGLAQGDEDALAALSRVRAALPAGAPPRWEELQLALEDLLFQLAS